MERLLSTKISARTYEGRLLEGAIKYEDQRHGVALEMEDGTVFTWHLIDFMRMVDTNGDAGNYRDIKFVGLVAAQTELIALFEKEQILYEVIATTRIGIYSVLEQGESPEHAMRKATPELMEMAHGESFTRLWAETWD